jgi:enamidase
MNDRDPSAGSVLIRNIGALASGDVRRPLLDASSIFIADGVIAEIGTDRPAAQTIDAGGNLVAPGLWDAHHHPYFGDYTPRQDATGYLERTIKAGTTSVVSAGTVHLPGRPRDAQGTKQLAILAARSWIYDRPYGMKVHAGTVIAEPGLKEADFADMARVDVRRLKFLTPIPTIREAEQYAAWARANGMVVMAHSGGRKLIDEADSIGHALRVIKPDVAAHVNGGPTPPADEDIQWLFANTRCAMDLVLIGNLQVARRVIETAVERDELERIVIGTDTPSAAGVMPSGVQRMVQLITTVANVKPEQALAFASGNTARVFGLSGGRVEVGQPADLLIGGAGDQSPYADGLDALARGGWLAVSTVLVDGQIQVHGDATTGPPRQLATLVGA